MPGHLHFKFPKLPPEKPLRNRFPGAGGGRALVRGKLTGGPRLPGSAGRVNRRGVTGWLRGAGAGVSPVCACAVRSHRAGGGAAPAPGGVGGPRRPWGAEPGASGRACLRRAPSETPGAEGRGLSEATPGPVQRPGASGARAGSAPAGLRARPAGRGRAEPAFRGTAARGGRAPGAAGAGAGAGAG